jgi:hypothetical protein
VAYFLVIFWHLSGMTDKLNEICTRNKRPVCADVNLGPPELDALILGQVQLCQGILNIFLFLHNNDQLSPYVDFSSSM